MEQPWKSPDLYHNKHVWSVFHRQMQQWNYTTFNTQGQSLRSVQGFSCKEGGATNILIFVISIIVFNKQLTKILDMEIHSNLEVFHNFKSCSNVKVSIYN